MATSKERRDDKAIMPRSACGFKAEITAIHEQMTNDQRMIKAATA
jgi:hypothetical protein